jgi:Leucine-rich repeat (LRR) protein
MPELIPTMVKSENLDLSYNNLKAFPNELWNLKNLKLLSLVSNPWNENTKEVLVKKAELLRQQEVIVNLSELEEAEND